MIKIKITIKFFFFLKNNSNNKCDTRKNVLPNNRKIRSLTYIPGRI